MLINNLQMFAGVLRELVLIGGGAALGALVPLAAGAHAAVRGAARPRTRTPLAAHCTTRTAAQPHTPLAPVYRPYHKFIG